MIPAAQFKSHGDKLDVGQQININHDFCPAGADVRSRLYIKRLDDKVVAYCHNCGQGGVAGYNKSKIMSVQELLRYRAAVEEAGELGEIVLPADTVGNPGAWPLIARAWLYKYNLTDTDIVEAGFGWSPSWGRVILPVYESGKLVFWQGRAVLPGDKPKYVNVRGKAKAMASYLRRSSEDTVVLVEDIVSAVRLSNHCDSIAFLGTSPDFDGLIKRIENYKHVGIWLDPDFAGQHKASELYARLNLALRADVQNIAYGKQPKETDEAMMKAIVGGLRSSSGSTH